jgi:hypothetical protein
MCYLNGIYLSSGNRSDPAPIAARIEKETPIWRNGVVGQKAKLEQGGLHSKDCF